MLDKFMLSTFENASIIIGNIWINRGYADENVHPVIVVFSYYDE